MLPHDNGSIDCSVSDHLYLTKALLSGGTAEQKRTWLPRIATGQLMVVISVTEPDTGSDVASVQCRAETSTVDGHVLNGAEAWCPFAGRADVIALLARTDPDPKSETRGLSLFIVEKEAFPGHTFEMQPLDDYFMSTGSLVGGEAGLNQGFYLQMAGFAAGHLQTGGRATGLEQSRWRRAPRPRA